MDSVSEYPFLARMVRAARFERDLYRSVADDPRLTRDAVLIVLAGAVAWGIAAALDTSIQAEGSFGGGALRLILSPIFVLLGWSAWAFIAWFIGTRMFGATAPLGMVVRGLGFAQAPTVLFVLGFVPVLGGIVQFVVGIWVFATSFFAIRETLDLSTGQTLATLIIGFVTYVIVIVVILTVVVVGVAGAAVGGGLLFGAL